MTVKINGSTLEELLALTESMRALILQSVKKSDSDQASCALLKELRRALDDNRNQITNEDVCDSTKEQCPKCKKILSIASIKAHAKKCGTPIPADLDFKIRNFKAYQMRIYRSKGLNAQSTKKSGLKG